MAKGRSQFIKALRSDMCFLAQTRLGVCDVMQNTKKVNVD